jgi:hypothetical protein
MSVLKKAALLSVLGSTQMAAAWDVSVQLTADNVYGIYTGDSTSVSAFHGSDVNTLAQHIVDAESYNFNMANGDVIYVAVWSDDATSQGLLAEFVIDGTILTTSNTDWEVAATGVNLGLSSPMPTLDELTTQIGLANAGTVPSGGWVPSTIGELNNGSGPNFPTLQVSSMSESVNWAWYDSGNCTGTGQPFKPGCDHDEYLIFRLAIPLGGCCLPDDECQNTSEAVCEELGGFYEGDGEFCEIDTTCVEETTIGACCIGGTCYDLETDKCADENGIWFGPGSTCDDEEVQCESDPTLEMGACCIDGDCADLTIAECWERSGSSFGASTSCADEEVVCETVVAPVEEVAPDKGCTSLRSRDGGVGAGLGVLGVFGLLARRKRKSHK